MRNWRLDEDEEEGEPKPDMPMTAGPVQNALFKSRTVLIFGPINMRLAERVTAQLLALANDDAEKPIRVIINSPGGHVESGDTIHDMIKFCGPQVKMIGTGWVASAATHIYLAVPKERRFATENTRFLIHQPSGGGGGSASDIAIQAREIVKMRERIAQVIAKETGQPIERVREDIDRDYWMSATEAIDYGIVGKLIVRQSELPG